MPYFIKESENKYDFFSHYRCTVLAFAFFLIFLCPLFPGGSEVIAQDNTNEKKADFLFQKPDKYVGFRFGIFSPEADSDLFDMITEELTLKKSDFRAWDFGIDVGFNLHEKIDLILSLDYSSRTKDSEFRYWEDLETGYPVTQKTKFSQTPLTVGIKYLLATRGRQIGQFSWLPSRFVPYVTGGAGVLWYEFRQDGDFVDFSDQSIFSAALESDSSVITGYLGCGTDINIYKSTYINLDFRYYWADDDLDDDFVGFDPIELSGYRMTAGIQWHF